MCRALGGNMLIQLTSGKRQRQMVVSCGRRGGQLRREAGEGNYGA